MRPIAPRINGADEFNVAEGQHEYLQLVGAHVRADQEGAVAVGDTPRDTLVFRYTLSAEERARVAGGEDIYLSLMSAPIAPHHLRVGWP